MGIMDQLKETWKENQMISKERRATEREFKKQARDEQLHLSKIFRSSKKYDKLQIDCINRLWKYGAFGTIKTFDDILDIDIYENGSSVQSTSTGSMVGRAVVGSLINSAGAIIGGVTAKKKSSEIISTLQVQIKTTDINTPIIRFDFIDKPIKKDSKDYMKAYTKAQDMQASLQAALR